MTNLSSINRRLEKAENLVYNALNNAKVGLWSWDFKNDMVEWDNNLLELFEMEYDYFKNGYQGYKEIVLPEYYQELEQKLNNCIENNVRLDMIYKIKSKNSIGQKTILVKGNLNSERTMMYGICVEI